ncbi:hypothetical protein [Gordonia sp. SMJS1]|uniref:hypothetical protein n=1 Tax=Gordonia sp. SMJS1 TaxID=3039400 RepID=UPI002455BD44|nr:hypothetical protein [Gordonia sp. SMJS1]WGJ84239.1 hypothetical protein QAD21_15760 [Gordonia sp. SMJS1]
MNRDQFDRFNRNCEQYTGRPWDGTIEHLDAAHARQAEMIEILNAHVAWLSATKERVERRGEPWNTRTCREQSRRDGDLAAPPQWLGNYSENCTPEWKRNR